MSKSEATVELNEQESVYIIFSSTNCGIGKFIRTVTGGFYNHVSVSFDPSLREMYSFARYHKSAPLYAGFVCESCERYLANKATPIKVCRIPLNSERYLLEKSRIEQMRVHKNYYVYNLLSAIFYPLHYKVDIKDAYTCVEFAVTTLNNVGIPKSIPRFCSIQNLETLLADRVVYEGLYPEPSPSTVRCDDRFFDKIGFADALFKTLWNNARLVKRLILQSLKLSH